MRKTFFYLVIIIVSLSTGYSQGYDMVKEYYTDHFVFTSGLWVYKDTVSHNLDSVELVNFTNAFLSPNPVSVNYQEYFLMEYSSSWSGTTFNDFIVTDYWKRNGGGVYGELGQPVMHMGQYDSEPQVGNGFNGYEIINIQNMIIQGSYYHDVVLSRVYAAQQYQHEFDYDTDLYFAPGTGLVRKEYTDSSGVHHVWELIYHQSSIYVGMDRSQADEIIIYPNPSTGLYKLNTDNIESVIVLNELGKMVLRTSSNTIDLSDQPDGIYLLKIFSKEQLITKKIVKY